MVQLLQLRKRAAPALMQTLPPLATDGLTGTFQIEAIENRPPAARINRQYNFEQQLHWISDTTSNVCLGSLDQIEPSSG